VSLNTTAEWWRPESLLQQDSTKGAQLNFALKTDDSPLAYRALIAFLFILLISPQSIFPVLAPLRLAMLAVAVAVIAHIAGRFRVGRPVMELTPETVIVLWLLGWAIVTVPFSVWPGGSVTFLLEFYLKTLVLFWLLSNVINTLPRLRTMAWALCLMSVPIALTGVKNYLAGVFFMEGSGRVEGYSAPLTGNPNDLALMLNLLIPVCIALLLSTKKPVIRLVLIAIIALNVLAVFMTFSRAGFLTLVVILMVYIWTLRKRPERRWAYLILLVVVVATPLAPSNYINRISTITDIEADQSGSSQERWSHMVLATQYVSKHPVTGAGLGMNIVAMDQERGSYGTAIHNVYLQHAVELGLPGLFLFVLLLKTSIKNVSTIQKRLQDYPPAEIFYLAEGIRISLIAFAVAAMFHPVGYHFYFYIIAGLSAAIKTIFDAGIRSHTDNAIARAV